MSDNAISAAYGRALVRSGQDVTFQRINGHPPNTSVISATVRAIVRDYSPDIKAGAETGYGQSQLGAITQGDRSIIVMSQDLQAKRFPLPLKKNDKVILVSSGEQLNIVQVDPFKRELGGAIECKAAGVA